MEYSATLVEELEEGMALETIVGEERTYSEEVVGKYRISVIVLGVLSALLGLAVLLLLISK